MAIIRSLEIIKTHEGGDVKKFYHFSEKLSYSTIKIKTKNGKVGTGFFFVIQVEGKDELILITNKHVLNYNPEESVILNFHIMDKTNNSLSRKDIDFDTTWYFHSKLDLCFAYIRK